MVTILLSFSESASLDAGTMRISELVFEATSAFATVGLSHGITGSLSTTGKIILITQTGVLWYILQIPPDVGPKRFQDNELPTLPHAYPSPEKTVVPDIDM